MPKLTKVSHRIQLKLTPKERQQLIQIRDTDTKAYRRERAAALLKVAFGQSPHAVAKSGLLKERDPDTVYRWVKTFVKDGIPGLTHQPRRKPQRVRKNAQQALRRILIQQTPQDYGSVRARWSLKTLKAHIGFLSDYTLSGIWYLLRRLRFAYKRGRDWQRSPDKAKASKIRRIRGCLGYARRFPKTVAFLLLDEFSYYRQPKVAAAWWPMGRRYQPPAIRSCGSNTRGRIVGALNGISGKLSYRCASSITVNVFCAFLMELAAEYSHCEKIYLVLDNWNTVHRHPKVLALMAELGITPQFLPTYSPESNPIEKLWQALSEAILHLHRDSSCWVLLKEKVTGWLSALQAPSAEILKTVGLLSRPAIGCNRDVDWRLAYH